MTRRNPCLAAMVTITGFSFPSVKMHVLSASIIHRKVSLKVNDAMFGAFKIRSRLVGYKDTLYIIACSIHPVWIYTTSDVTLAMKHRLPEFDLFLSLTLVFLFAYPKIAVVYLEM